MEDIALFQIHSSHVDGPAAYVRIPNLILLRDQHVNSVVLVGVN